MEFAHVGGLLAAGGCAVAADRLTLIASRRDLVHRRAQLEAQRSIHRIVLVGLVVVVVSGVLLFASDVDTFIASRVFWIKMAFVGLLGVNGLWMLRAERLAAADTPAGWRHLTHTATASLFLWFILVFLGAALINV